MKLDSNNHSVFLLHYHLVLVVKYRRKVFDDALSEYTKEMFERLGENYNITLVEWNHDGDHVHVLFKAHPNTEMTKFINAFKSASSQIDKKRISSSETKIVERNVLVSKLLFVNYRWFHDRCGQKIY